MNAFIRESKLSVVYYRDQLELVILIIVYERPKIIIDILVYNFCLFVCLRVERYR